MYDESMNRNTSDNPSAALDALIVHALEHIPEVQIPEGFAARVASHVPARPIISVRSTYYGRSAMVISMVLLLTALLLLAGHRTDISPFGVVLQWTLFAQFIGLIVWFSLRRYRTL